MIYKLYDISIMTDSEYQKWYSVMDSSKQARVDRFMFEDDKKRTVAGDMLAREMISKACNIAPEDILFSKNNYGKPFVNDLDIEFNISHSGEYVLCAIDDNPIGVDIEKIRPVDISVIKRVCNNDELDYVLQSNNNIDEDTFKRFFEIWTAKEAYFKCLGTGIADVKSCRTQELKFEKCCISNKFFCSFFIENSN